MRIVTFVFLALSPFFAVSQSPQGPDRVHQLLLGSRKDGYEVASTEELAQMGATILPAAISTLRTHPDSAERLLVMLGRVATKALVGLLDDDNMCVPALQILATIADPAAITPVEHLLQRTSDDATRLEAAICLSQLGSSLGPAALAETAVGGSDYAWEAAVSLANAPGATLEQLTLSLQVAPWSMSGTMDAPSVAATRILAMGTRGRDSLSKRVRDRDSAAASAMSALSQAPPPDFIKLISESASRAASSDQFFDMAIRVLAEIGTSDAVEALMNLSRHDESSDARVTFALLHEALTGRLRRVDNRIIEWLTTRLDKFPDSLVALAALRKDDPQMVTLVESRLKSPFEEQSKPAHQALLLLRGPAAVHLQIRTFESSEEGKADLFLFLKDIRDDQVLSLLERYYHDEVWQWRVVSALGNFPGQRAGGLLLRAVTSKHDHIQAQAIVSLGEIRCALAVKPLCDLLMNPKSQELGWQSQLLVALGRIGSKEAIPVIARFLHAPQELRRSVLRDAIEAISTIGGAESVPVLMDLYRHVRPDQQESIILAVAKARGEVAEKFLETIAADDSEYLRLRRIARDNLKDHKGLVPRHEPSGGYWSVGDPEGINEVR